MSNSLPGNCDSLPGNYDSLAGNCDSLAGNYDSLAGNYDSLAGSNYFDNVMLSAIKIAPGGLKPRCPPPRAGLSPVGLAAGFPLEACGNDIAAVAE